MAYDVQSGTSNYLSLSSPWSHNSEYTIAFWYKTPSSFSQEHKIFYIGSAYNISDELRTSSSVGRFSLQVNNISGQVISNSDDSSTNTWYHIAISRQNYQALVLYVNGEYINTNTFVISGRAAPTEVRFMNTPSYGQGYGTLSNIKVWTSALYTTDIKDEMNSMMPRRWLNLYAWWPLIGE